MSQTYENSSSFIEGFAAALEKVGARGPVLAKLEPAERKMMEDPRAQRWWPGHMFARVVQAFSEVSDAATVERAAYLSIESSVAPVAMPLVKVTIALSGSSPATIFAMAGTFGSTALRGVQLHWRKDSPVSGELSATYPDPVPAPYEGLWRGTIAFVYEITKVHGTTAPVRFDDGGRTLRIPVSWEAKK